MLSYISKGHESIRCDNSIPDSNYCHLTAVWTQLEINGYNGDLVTSYEQLNDHVLYGPQWTRRVSQCNKCCCSASLNALIFRLESTCLSTLKTDDYIICWISADNSHHMYYTKSSRIHEFERSFSLFFSLRQSLIRNHQRIAVSLSFLSV